MMPTLRRVGRVLRKPPHYVMRRAWAEIRHELDRFSVPARARKLDCRELVRRLNAADLDSAWEALRFAPKPWPVERLSTDACERVCPGDSQRIFAAAERACRHEIDLMGSGSRLLGPQIDWHRDYKTGDRWPLGYFRSIDYVNRGRPSDVKTVWELSRLQWLIPAGQAYLLSGDERYAKAVRDVLDQWIAANPYACSVNWGVTMEPAMRIFSWVWFFHVFAGSRAWSDAGFRERFLASLYLHAEFTERFLERSDVNGNHFTADAAALLVAGVFFGASVDGPRWFADAARDLEHEIELQVFPDGVDFEASVPYHRLVAELLLHASMWAQIAGRRLSDKYRHRLAAMGHFTVAYTRDDGTVPLWGDADDARTLPFGGQHINDHRYLPGLIGLHLDDATLLASGADKAEAFWCFGEHAAQRLQPARAQSSRAFEAGGFFVMRNASDHVFIDCGKLGLADRGGHGHNDILSFEAMLAGELLIVDRGSYLYTASFEERNAFRSTAYHNTPCVDGEEINRFIGPEYLWNLHCDAQPQLREWHSCARCDRIVMSHSGYERLAAPVRPVRRIELDHASHTLSIEDRFEGGGEHRIAVPLHFAPGVELEVESEGTLTLVGGRRSFRLQWSDARHWQLQQGRARVSPSYGIALGALRLEWSCKRSVDAVLRVTIAPFAT